MSKEKKTGRLLVIGDIHGQFDKLERVLELAGFKSGRDRLILLGDYVDRGPCSRQVLDKVLSMVESGAVALKGNHEEMMRIAMQGVVSGHIQPPLMEQWFANGGEITLDSYRDHRDCLLRHLNFLETLPVSHEEGGYLFVHAGVRPGVPLEKQRPDDLIWIRDEYIKGYKGPWKVVSGHTPTISLARWDEHPKEDPHRPIVREHQIFMDTGVAWGGLLTIMELPSEKIWQA